MTRTAPHGTWQSSIDARSVAEVDGRPGWVSQYGGELWWTEPRPTEGGRLALLRGTGDVVLPPPWNVRSRVHEYGGRAYVIAPAPGGAGPAVVFSEFSDQRLYRYEPEAGERPEPLTPEPDRPAGLRYVEPVTAPDGHEIWCIREELTGPEPTDVRRCVVAVPLDGSGATKPEAVRELVADTHFLSCPRPSPDGSWLSWIGWNHPAMPWDSTLLRVARVRADGSVGEPVTVAGGAGQAIVQAEWESDGALLYAADPVGWWNLHRVELDADGHPAGAPVNLCPREEEFGGPLWQLGMQWFTPLGGGRVAVIHGRAATRLSILDTAGSRGELAAVEPESGVGFTEWAPTLAPSIAGVAGSDEEPYRVVAVDPDTLVATDVTRPRTPPGVADGHLPRAQARTFSGPGGRDIHAIVSPPRNDEFTGPSGELAPYVVFAHGGPTSRVPMVADLEVAYFTSRGIGVVEVNYGGSTGHGREYRERLRENWGVVDVEDCVAVARALADEGTADPQRLAIRGGSAGGWTAAAALTFTDVFACGVIQYPILDLVGWRTGETHDFESQYLESLVGPWPAVEQRYRERSPMTFPERVSAPFLLMQGLEDEICPPVQAERFVAAVAGRGVPHAYLTFDGEQHGFRKAETIVAALEAELSLYARVFGFEPADDLPPLSLHT
ncbi:S9 family peptidase [Actinobacteria bacterium YIM 96077]|uniref:S9 family peptidase n=1 Tax=Phytoactinopolyspora halophila TaxID=1981511 RepID=A0A329QVL0_9ACTN|nr:prolyl oligopeptidase family serine peptidase [Phytoactinopolyspora halophila]AYY12752.1 S9 family peptidase [Actinobacteria bacterium YIM 96077]RAW16454.1 S9 family peptidase [Phytoactinopolyspora halophila]